jgi:hypothetical protein
MDFVPSTSFDRIVARYGGESFLLLRVGASRAYSAAFVIHGESIPEDRSVVESSALDIEDGEGKSVCMASCFSEGQHIYSTSFLS